MGQKALYVDLLTQMFREASDLEERSSPRARAAVCPYASKRSRQNVSLEVSSKSIWDVRTYEHLDLEFSKPPRIEGADSLARSKAPVLHPRHDSSCLTQFDVRDGGSDL